MEIRVRLKSTSWDKEIIRWLKSIPKGHRTTMVKYALIRFIQGETEAKANPKAKTDTAPSIPSDLLKKLDRF